MQEEISDQENEPELQRGKNNFNQIKMNDELSMGKAILDNFNDMVEKNLKDSIQNYFTLENPNHILIMNIIVIWQARKIKTIRCFLRLFIQKCKLDYNAIVPIFQNFPSIILILDGKEIKNSNTLQAIDQILYEGNSKFLCFYDFKKQLEYQGEVENRVPHGKGYMKSTNKNDIFVYFGQFNQGTFHGWGELEDSTNNAYIVRYVGQFKDDLKHGNGDEVILTQNKKGKTRKWHYKGRFVNGRREGQGKQTSHLGLYQGSWKDGEKCGRGTFKFKKGNQYDGSWSQGKFHGNGILIEKKKGVYKGDFQNGLFHGKGVYSYENGDKYEGFFENNLRSGQGIYTWRDGDYYQGQWSADKAHGKGSTLIGLTFYQGQFKHGYKHGKGELTDQNGNIIIGKWENNKKVQQGYE